MPQLVIEKGNNRNVAIAVSPGDRVVIGRDKGANLQLLDVMASRRHFAVFSEGREFILKDLGSVNGTFVNGRRIAQDRLALGDSIQVGETLLSFLPDNESAKRGGLVGKEIGGYRITERLGRGAMGTVYLAVQKSLDRTVALKILAPELLKKPNFVEMFVKEARACAALNHPNIVQVYDVGEAHGIHFFSMEYAGGGSVQERIANNGLLPAPVAIPYMIDACQALEYAERRGIVHRDIKPDNLFLDADDHVKVGDLGLAHNVQSDPQQQSGVFGTPHYIAPEQALGDPIDHRADIYALGGTFFRIVTGSTPYSGSNIREILRKQVQEPPPYASERQPEVPRAVADIIYKMMAKARDARYYSAAEVIPDLERAKRAGSMRSGRRGAVPGRPASVNLGAPPAPKLGRGIPPVRANADSSRHVAPERGRRVEASGMPTGVVLGLVLGVLAIGALVLALALGGDDAPSTRPPARRPRGPIPMAGVNNNTRPVNVNRPNRPINTSTNRGNRGNGPGPGSDLRLRNQRIAARISAKIDALLDEHGLTQAAIAALTDYEREVAQSEKDYVATFGNPVTTALPAVRAEVAELKALRQAIDKAWPVLQGAVKQATTDGRYGDARQPLADFRLAHRASPDASQRLRDAIADALNRLDTLDDTLDRAAAAAFAVLVQGVKQVEAQNTGGDFDARRKRATTARQALLAVERWKMPRYWNRAQAQITKLDALRSAIDAEEQQALKGAVGALYRAVGLKLQAIKADIAGFRFGRAYDKWRGLRVVDSFRQTQALAATESRAKALLDIIARKEDQLRRARDAMQALRRQLKGARLRGVPRPTTLEGVDGFRANTVEITDADEMAVIMHGRARAEQRVLWTALTAPEVHAIMERALGAVAKLPGDTALGFAIIMLERGQGTLALALLERAAKLLRDAASQALIKDYRFYAYVFEIKRLIGEGSGAEAQKRLKLLKDEFSDTPGFREWNQPGVIPGGD